MINECMQVFDRFNKAVGGRALLDSYMPKDGTYLFVNILPNSLELDKNYLSVSYDKKNKQLNGSTDSRYPLLTYLDYQSRLLEMNKPVDTKKIIHSNNYLSFAVKKTSILENKLTKKIIDDYYAVLENPSQKYKSKAKAYDIYTSLEKLIGKPDKGLIKRIKDWTTKNLLLSPLQMDWNQKDYLKVYFIYWGQEDKTRQLYDDEGKRYFIPNIFNNNDFNLEIGGSIYGLSNNNMGMNAKKPYLENKSRKVTLPYLINQDQAMDQNDFFAFLLAQVSQGKPNVFFDADSNLIEGHPNGQMPNRGIRGYYLYLQKGTNEAEIQSYSILPGFTPELPIEFLLDEILSIKKEDMLEFTPGYGKKYRKDEMQILLNEVMFSKYLLNNYFTKPGDLKIDDNTVKTVLLQCREGIWRWLYLDDKQDIAPLLIRGTRSLIWNSFTKGYIKHVKHQINLYWSLQQYFNAGGRTKMEVDMIISNLRKRINGEMEAAIEDPEEYYYAVGQFSAYIQSLSKARSKPMSFVNQFINAKTDEILKKRLIYFWEKYNYSLENTGRAPRLMGSIMTYKAVTPPDQIMMIAGYVSKNLVYEKKEGQKNG